MIAIGAAAIYNSNGKVKSIRLLEVAHGALGLRD